MEIAGTVPETLKQFPDRLSPVFVRDLRQGLRAHYLVWAFILFQVVGLLATLLEVSFKSFFDASAGGVPFSMLLQVAFGFGFGLILPLTQFAALQSEVGAGRNIELLLASTLTRWQIVWGKFLVAASLSGLLLVSLLPYLLLRYFLGNVELTSIAGLVATTYLGNLVMNAIVIGASGYRNPVGRVAVIVYFYLIYSFTMLGGLRGLTGGGFFGASTIFAYVAYVLAGALIVVLMLQLGRSRIKLFEDPLDPPSSAGVFAIGFLVPIANGIAYAIGGGIASCVVLGLLFWLVLMIDRGPGRYFEGKGFQP
jgi:hypothetical protein